ncbi:MAG TPA: hypothetical protein VKE22_01100 [Haliangiales bacterium]|nr:hypothetical protein [Haliangiales bacterium]
MRIALALLLVTLSASAQEAGPAPAPAPPRATTLNLQIKGAQKPLIDTIQGTMFEKSAAYSLLILGGKGKGTFSCEVRSASPYVLMEVMHTVLTAHEVTVSCLNANTSGRGGALVDLEDPKSGSFVISAVR